MTAYLSDSLISEALVMIQAMKQNNCFALSQVNSIRTYYGINKVAALDLAIQCNWIVINNGTSYVITPFGEDLLRRFNGSQIQSSLYRDILRKYIAYCKPIWARRIPYGRNEAFRIMSDEEQLCFKKAGLMNNPVTRDEVDWWDAIAETERQKKEHLQDDIGRKGEELTIAYEKERTNASPIWESVDSNLAGFDILSQVSKDDSHSILIEVKSTSQTLEDADFFISRNEWDFASAGYNQNRYFFYLWLLGKSPNLAIVSYYDMQRHISLDSGLGVWKDVRIPFSAFQEWFHSV